MGHTPTISISHNTTQLESHYVLAALAMVWERNGFRVDVGPSYSAHAAACVLHHDLTRLDPASLPEPPPGMQPVNGQVLDISKKTYSTLMLRPEDDWRGPVIVKTNLNHFGVPEGRAAGIAITTKVRRRLARISWRHARMLPDRAYPLLSSLDDVPNWVWTDPGLIVEKFIPERVDDDLYCLRGWMFFGDKSYGYRLFSADPLVKAGTMVRYEYLDEVPDDLMSLREGMGFDFGKFDYVEHAGKPILLDANKTPVFTGASDSPRLRLLADGIKAFL